MSKNSPKCSFRLDPVFGAESRVNERLLCRLELPKRCGAREPRGSTSTLTEGDASCGVARWVSCGTDTKLSDDRISASPCCGWDAGNCGPAVKVNADERGGKLDSLAEKVCVGAGVSERGGEVDLDGWVV